MRTTKEILVLSMTALMATALTAPALSRDADDYKVIQVADGGTIVGTVKFDGQIPKRRRLKVASRDKACLAKSIPNDDLVVSREAEVRWAVISINGIDAGKPFPAADSADGDYRIDQKGCRFFPHVAIVPQGRSLKVINSDGILHNVHTRSLLNASRNTSMPGPVKEIQFTFRRPEEIKVNCDVHNWMAAWIVVIEHPYYVVSDKDGLFRLEDVPAGTYTLRLWHETLGELEQEVTVEAGGQTNVQFVLRNKKR